MQYRILHKPTGLYFRPSRKIKNKGGYYVKSNLSDKGKVYHTYPSLGWAAGKIHSHLNSDNVQLVVNAPIDNWEIVPLGSELPKRHAGISDEEYVMEIGRKVYFDYVVAHANPSQPDEIIKKTLIDAFVCGVEAIDKARADFNLQGAL